jgi:TrmH family RNA methyltransferase
MITKEITSLQHPIVKRLVKLRQDRAFRYREKSVLIAGNKLVKEIGPYSEIKLLLLEKGRPLPIQMPAAQILKVTGEIMKKITGLENPEPVAAEVGFPPPGELKKQKLLLALDGVADPGNVGTLLRTAHALGWEGAFLTKNCADPFNEKSLRAAKGATFRLPLVMGSWHDLETFMQQNKCHPYVADMEGESFQEEKYSFPLVLILGNESHGVNPLAKKYTAIKIPMKGNMESLNVAIAGGILMQYIRGMQ